jgi:hypothetical protein
MLATTEAALRRETAALLVQIRRRLCKLGDEVRLSDFRSVEALLDRTRQHDDPTLKRLAMELARECGLTEPRTEIESDARTASPEPTAASGQRPSPTTDSETTRAEQTRRARAAQRARELERLLSAKKARTDHDKPADAGAPAEGVTVQPPPPSIAAAPPGNDAADERQSVMARLNRLAKSLKRPTVAPAIEQQGTVDAPDRAKKKIMYRGRVIEV